MLFVIYVLFKFVVVVLLEVYRSLFRRVINMSADCVCVAICCLFDSVFIVLLIFFLYTYLFADGIHIS